MAIQAVIFNKKGYNVRDALDWLKTHDITPKSMKPIVTEKHLKFNIKKKGNKKRKYFVQKIFPGITLIIMI